MESKKEYYQYLSFNNFPKMKIAVTKWLSDWWFVLGQFFHTTSVNGQMLILNTPYSWNKKLNNGLFTLRAQLELKCDDVIIKLVKSDFYLWAWHCFSLILKLIHWKRLKLRNLFICCCIHVHFVRFLWWIFCALIWTAHTYVANMRGNTTPPPPRETSITTLVILLTVGVEQVSISMDRLQSALPT